jgi:hypothetical protein
LAATAKARTCVPQYVALVVLAVLVNATVKDALIGTRSSASADLGARATVIAASASDPSSFVMIEIPPAHTPGTGGKKGHPVLVFFVIGFPPA